MTHTRYCANCLAHQPVDTLIAQACERATIPAREFCSACGYFFGYIPERPSLAESIARWKRVVQ